MRMAREGGLLSRECNGWPKGLRCMLLYGQSSMFRPISFSLELPSINHRIAGTAQHQPLYPCNCPISTIVSPELPNINHCIAATAHNQQLFVFTRYLLYKYAIGLGAP